MGQDARFEKWASGILGVVSLMLALHLAWSYTLRHREESRTHVAAHRPDVIHPKPQQISPIQEAASREAPRVVDHPPRHKAPPVVVESRHNSGVNLAAHDADPIPVIVAQASAAPVPATKEFQAIGYVEKPDGTRQAVISEGNQIFVVHDGEIFDEHYRVLSISSTVVEAADLTVPQPAPSATPSEPVLSAQLARPAEATATAAPAKPLGYVERPGRPPETIVAERDGVRLVPQSTVTDSSLVASAGSVAVPAGTQPNFASSQAFVSHGSFAEKNDMAISAAVASRPETVTATAELRGSVINADDEPVELALGRTSRPAGEEGSSSADSSSPPAAIPSESSYQILKAFCYVEGEESGRQAFVALGNSVYSVREGTILADRYRVLKIAPGGVEVEDAGGTIRPPPQSGEEFAQNSIHDDEAPDVGNQSPPAELPWDEFVRSVSFLWSNSATTGGSFGAEPALFAKNQSEPTSQEAASSSLLGGVGPPLISLRDHSIPSVANPFEDSSAKKDQAGSKSNFLDVPRNIEARVIAHSLKADGIALLPLRVAEAALLEIPVFPGARSLTTNSRSGEESSEVRRSSAPAFDLGGMQASRSANVGNSAPVIASSATLFSAPISMVSGRDLLLPFSVSDNGCSIP